MTSTQTISVIDAGTMGTGIAQACAAAGQGATRGASTALPAPKTSARSRTRSRAWARAAALARRCALICLCATSGAVPAAEWTLSGLAGAGNNINVAGVEAQVPSGYGGALTDPWSWSLGWAGDVAYWRARNQRDSARSLWEIGLTPVVELRRPLASGVSYYVEGGIGIHLLSHTRIDGRTLSTAFQFGEFVGTGVNFGDHGEYGVGVRLQHISNGCIKEPNYGATYGELRVSYRWE